MSRLAKLFVVMVSLLMLNFSFAKKREFILYNSTPIYITGSVTLFSADLYTGCMGIKEDGKKNSFDRDCFDEKYTWDVNSWEDCKDKCSNLDGKEGREKCIAFSTTRKSGDQRETSCDLYRDGVIEVHEHSNKKHYLYYDEGAVKVFDKKSMPTDKERWDPEARTRIVMINKKHLDFFDKDINNTFGRLIRLDDIKGLEIKGQEINGITLVCKNLIPKSHLLSLKKTESKKSGLDKIPSLEEFMLMVDKKSGCGQWILKHITTHSDSDLFELNGPEPEERAKLNWWFDSESGGINVSFKCDMCHFNLANSSPYVLTRSLELYLKKYYQENTTEK